MATCIRKRVNGYLFLQFLFFIGFLLSSCSIQKAQKQLLNAAPLKGAHVGIAIYNETSAKWIQQYQQDHYFTPASNVKIAATYLGLSFLGDSIPGWAVAEKPDTLFLIPKGDPSFLHPEFSYQPVWERLKNTQKVIAICLDASKDNFGFFGNGWSWNDYDQDYQPERSRIPIYGNVVHFYQKNKKLISIAPFFFFKNNAALASAEGKDWTRNFLTQDFFPTTRKNESNYFQVPFKTNDSFKQLLEDTLKKPIIVLNQFEHILGQTKILKTVPTDSLLKIMMHRSDNFYAEQILLMASEQLLGSMNDAAIIDSFSKTEFASLPNPMRWVDGSGLSRYNLNTPANFIAILQQMQAKFGEARLRSIFEKGGEGTLSNYYSLFPGVIYAKTGTLGNQVALSGLITTAKRQKLFFSVLVANHMSKTSAGVRREVERYLTKVASKN